MNEYRNTFPWSQFVNIKPLGATGIRQTEQDERSCSLYDLSGKRISKPIKGVYVRNGKKQVTINTIK